MKGCCDWDNCCCDSIEEFSCRGGSEFSRIREGLEKAQERYNVAVATGKAAGPYLVAEDVQLLAFELLDAHDEGCWRLGFDIKGMVDGLQVGDVLMYGDPSRIHECITTWFGDTVCGQATKHFMLFNSGVKFRGCVRNLGASTFSVVRGKKAPDSSFATKSDALADVPRVAIEVAVFNEVFERLDSELSRWIESGSLLALGVKVDMDRTGDKLGLSLRFVYKAFDGTCQDIDFSPAACNSGNQDKFCVKLDFRWFTEDITDKDNFEVVYDLYQLQVEILETIWGQQEEATKDCDRTELFCYCRMKGEGQQMVSCRDPRVRHCLLCGTDVILLVQCSIVWFHAECVGVVGESGQGWVCPFCVENQMFAE